MYSDIVFLTIFQERVVMLNNNDLIEEKRTVGKRTVAGDIAWIILAYVLPIMVGIGFFIYLYLSDKPINK